MIKPEVTFPRVSEVVHLADRLDVERQETRVLWLRRGI